jgi:hypothetical protein
VSEQTVPVIGDAWVEQDTAYVVEWLDEDGDWNDDTGCIETATRAVNQITELLDEDVEPKDIRVIELLTIRRVMLGGELDARAKRERGEL